MSKNIIPTINISSIVKNDFTNEEIFVDKIDYYFTNVIARSSKTMAECRNLKLVSLKTGTDG